MNLKVVFTLGLLVILLGLAPTSTGQEEQKVIIRELFLNGNNTMTISSRALILTGNMTLRDESQLLITQSQIQMSIRGEKTYNVSTLEKGKLILSNSTLESLSNSSIIAVSNSSNMKLVNSKLKGFKEFLTSGNSTLTAQGSQLDAKFIGCAGKEVTINDGVMPKGRLSINCSKAELEKFKGDQIQMDVYNSTLNRIECKLLQVKTNLSVYLNNSKIKNCQIQSSENLTVANSYFDSLTLNSTGVAVNVTTAGGKAGGQIQAGVNATIQRYWYLKINVTEMSGIGIPARVIVEDYFGNTTLTANTGPDGLYFKPILAEIVNSSKTVFIGNYKIKAEYLNYSTRFTPVVLDGNKYIELRFKEDIPLQTSTKMKPPLTPVKVDEPIKIEGWINITQPKELIEITIIGPDDSRTLMATSTDERGNFTSEFNPSIQGQWTIYADWIGGSRYGERYTRSQAAKVTVEPRPSILELLIKALPIVVVVFGIIAAFAFLALSYSRGSRI